MRFPQMRGNISREDLNEVIELLREDDPKLTSGPRVKEFEKQWSNWLGKIFSLCKQWVIS